MGEKGFKVVDRRKVGRETEETAEKVEEKIEEKAEEKAKEKVKEEAEKTADLPPIDFSNFILSLSTSALLHLGEIEDPVSKKKETNLTIAKQSIDIISMLKEKTEGNLAKEEESLLDTLLYDLRMRYVKIAG